MKDHGLLVNAWHALSNAVRAREWSDVEAIARELEADLLVIARQRLVRGADGEGARSRHRDGLYAIGWQLLTDAPASAREAVVAFNATLHRIPGGVGRQPSKRRA